MSYARFLFCVSIWFGLGLSISAQEILFDIQGSNSGYFGAHVVGDMNLDGFDDVAVADNFQVEVLSGKDQQPLFSVPAPLLMTSFFGFRMINLGDVNQDGTPDLAISAEVSLSDHASIIVSGVDGSILHGPFQSAPTILDAGDVDGDGARDLVNVLHGPLMSSRVFVVSGRTSAVVFDLVESLNFGNGISAAGDTNGDGFDDLWATHASYENDFGIQVGRVVLLSGADTSVLHQIIPPVGIESFAEALRVADIDADGISDLAINGTSTVTGQFLWLFYSGSTFEHLFSIPQPDPQARSLLSSLGDITGDGTTDYTLDVLPFATPDNPFRLYSGASLAPVYSFDLLLKIYGTLPGGDVNSDGINDLTLFATGLNDFDTRVVILAGAPLWIDGPTVSVNAGVTFDLKLGELAPGSPALLVLTAIDTTSFFLPLTPFIPMELDGSTTLTLPAPVVLQGSTLRLLALGINAAGKLVASAEKAVSIQ